MRVKVTLKHTKWNREWIYIHLRIIEIEMKFEQKQWKKNNLHVSLTFLFSKTYPKITIGLFY